MGFNLDEAQGLLVDYRVDNKVRNFLNSLDKEIFYTDKSDFLMEEVNGHADMVACSVNKITVLEPRLFELYKERLKSYKVVLGKTVLAKDYPDDVAYNVAIVGDFAIGRLKSVDKMLLELINRANLSFLDVKQGYSKCSIAVVNENSIITADKSIASVCKEVLGVKLIEQDDGIKLGSMKGFIGGASFLWGKKLYFFGDVSNHIDYKEIKGFCKDREIELCSIGEGNLKDYGGIIPLYKL